MRTFNQNYAEIKEIYHYLQGKSTQYPNIDMFTMRHHFVKNLKILKERPNLNEIDIILRNVNQYTRDLEEKDKPGFTRFMFFEVCMRMAKHLYYETTVGRDCSDFDDDEFDYYGVKIHQSFDMFYKNDLMRFREDISINW